VWNAFGKRPKSAPDGKGRRRRGRSAGRSRAAQKGGLGGESLEQRALLAAFTYDGSTLAIDLDNSSEAITLTSSGSGNYVFTSSNNFSGTNTSGLTGNGTTTLTITSALSLASVAITDSATGTSVAFGTNSGTYDDNFSIALNNTPGQVTIGNATSFAGAAALQATTSRNISVTASLTNGTPGNTSEFALGVRVTGG
jgi:hypothetical protein